METIGTVPSFSLFMRNKIKDHATNDTKYKKYSGCCTKKLCCPLYYSLLPTLLQPRVWFLKFFFVWISTNLKRSTITVSPKLIPDIRESKPSYRIHITKS